LGCDFWKNCCDLWAVEKLLSYVGRGKTAVKKLLWENRLVRTAVSCGKLYAAGEIPVIP
jgi:hypothetical protein